MKIITEGFKHFFGEVCSVQDDGNNGKFVFLKNHHIKNIADDDKRKRLNLLVKLEGLSYEQLDKAYVITLTHCGTKQALIEQITSTFGENHVY